MTSPTASVHETVVRNPSRSGRGDFGAVAPIVIISSLLIEPHQAVLMTLVAGTLPRLQMLPKGLKDGSPSHAVAKV